MDHVGAAYPHSSFLVSLVCNDGNSAAASQYADVHLTQAKVTVAPGAPSANASVPSIAFRNVLR
jgi:hypothetical protein